MPFRRTLAAHAAISVTVQQHKLRSSLSFTAKDFDIPTDYDEKEGLLLGCRLALLQRSQAMLFHKRVCIYSSPSAHSNAHPA